MTERNPRLVMPTKDGLKIVDESELLPEGVGTTSEAFDKAKELGQEGLDIVNNKKGGVGLWRGKKKENSTKSPSLNINLKPGSRDTKNTKKQKIEKGLRKLSEKAEKLGKQGLGLGQKGIGTAKVAGEVVGQGIKGGMKDIKDALVNAAVESVPPKEILKEAAADVIADYKKVGKRGLGAIKSGIGMMAEGQRRSMNPEYGQPLDERPLPETPKVERTPTDPEFIKNLRAGLGARPEDDAMTVAREEWATPPPATEEPKEDNGEGKFKKYWKKFWGATKSGVNMVGEGHARSMNPERGQPYKDIVDEKVAKEESLYQQLDKEIKLDPVWKTKGEKKVLADLSKARVDYATAYKAFLTDRKEKAGKVKNAWRFIVGSKVSDSEIPPSLKALEANYDKMAIVYGQNMYTKKLEDLQGSGMSLEEQEAELKRYKQNEIFTRVVIQEQSMLNALKAENLPPKERNIAKKTLDWYLKQPRWKKMAISTALATGVFAATFGTTTVAGAVGVGAYAGKRLVRAFMGSTMAQGAVAAYSWMFKDKSGAEKLKQEAELSKMFEGEILDTSLAKSKKEYAEIIERERKAKRNRLITKAMVGIAAGGLTAWEMGHLAHGATSVAQNVAETPPTPTSFNPEDFNILKHTEQVSTPPSMMLDHHDDIATPDISPEVPHEILKDFSVKLGENGAPAHLETAFNEIAANHLDAPVDGIVNEEIATKSLNMAANMVKLAEGHDVARISHEDFAKVFSYHNGVLEGHSQGAEEILSKLQDQANQNWNNGVLQGRGAAITHINKISESNWVKIEHADGLPHDSVAGHAEVIGTTDFNHSELVQKAMEISEAKARVLESMDAKIESASETTAPSTTEPVSVAPAVREPVLTSHDQIQMGKVSPEDLLSDKHPTNHINNLGNRSLYVSEEALQQINRVYENNIAHMFPQDLIDSRGFGEALENTMHKQATEIIEMSKETALNVGDRWHAPFFTYFEKIKEVLGNDFTPRAGTMLRMGETTEEFIKRALTTAEERGPEYLDKLKF